MRCCGLFLLCFILCSCGGHTATNETVNAATNGVIALEKSLAKECLTDGVKTQITAIKTQIQTIGQVCEVEKDAIRHDKAKWQMAFFALLAVVGVYIAKKVLK